MSALVTNPYLPAEAPQADNMPPIEELYPHNIKSMSRGREGWGRYTPSEQISLMFPHLSSITLYQVFLVLELCLIAASLMKCVLYALRLDVHTLLCV